MNVRALLAFLMMTSAATAEFRVNDYRSNLPPVNPPPMNEGSSDIYVDVSWDPRRPDWKGLVLTNTGRKAIDVISVTLNNGQCVLWKDVRRIANIMDVQDLAERYAQRVNLRPRQHVFLLINSPRRSNCRPVYSVDVDTEQTDGPIHIDFDQPYNGVR
jgi:hypothetical protein